MTREQPAALHGTLRLEGSGQAPFEGAAASTSRDAAEFSLRIGKLLTRTSESWGLAPTHARGTTT